MKPALRCIAACAALALASADALAQQAPPPEAARPNAQAMPAAPGASTLAAIQAQLEVAARPETAERLAAFKRNLYEALLKKGFNGQDAMQIVIATPLPGAVPAPR